jgi:hypothetical protein
VISEVQCAKGANANMLKINRSEKHLSALQEMLLPDANLKERADLQQMIRNSPKAFFGEMGEELLLIGEEIRPDDFVDDRIDLLAIDKAGDSVIIELKRGVNKHQLLQALSYTAMVSKWDVTRFIEERALLAGQTEQDAEDEIEQFILEDIEDLNADQRVVLIAEDFDYSLLITAEWLSEAYGLDVRCYRIALSTDKTAEYLTCTCIYPPPAITEHAKRRGRTRSGSRTTRWKSWDEALQRVENQALVAFFQSEIEGGRENNLGRRQYLCYRVDGKRKFNVQLRQKNAYVWQAGRFDGDIEFWKSKLSAPADPQPVKQGNSLRFYLTARQDFDAFLEATSDGQKQVCFLSTDADNTIDDA